MSILSNVSKVNALFYEVKRGLIYIARTITQMGGFIDSTCNFVNLVMKNKKSVKSEKKEKKGC